MMKRFLAVATVLLLMGAGCGAKTPNVGTTTGTPSNPDAFIPVRRTVDITYGDNGFVPATVTIDKGNKVVWTNNSSGKLLVTSTYPGFNGGQPLGAGLATSFQFTQSGTWTYGNSLKPSDKGTVVVK